MHQNFKRQITKNKLSDDALDNYLQAKEILENIQFEFQNLELELENLESHLLLVDADIKKLDDDYKNNGGQSEDIWQKQFNNIDLEAKKREQINIYLKNTADKMIPFLILKPQIKILKEQISIEETSDLNNNFCKKISEQKTIQILTDLLIEDNIPIDYKYIKGVINKMVNKIHNSHTNNNNQILELSSYEKYSLVYAINKIEEFNEKSIENSINDINKSLKKSSDIRKKIKNCTIDGVQEYIANKEVLLTSKSELKENILKINYQLQSHEFELIEAIKLLEKTKKIYEIELKNGSIKDLSFKAIKFLEELQDELYIKQISKLEKQFLREINLLMHKPDFITDIQIDKHFNIILYTTKVFTTNEITDLKKSSENVILDLLGEQALEQLKTNNIIDNKLKIKLDEHTMSNGEKQIYIMALYKSLISLSKFEVPFVIDTPFARIDKMHRQNILEYFFKELDGQVFILSTDEEITHDNISILKDHINKMFTIENKNNKTLLLENNYFGKKYT